MDFENQEMLEKFFNKRQTMPMLREQFLSMSNVMDLVSGSGLCKDFCLDLLSHMALGKRYDVPALVGLLKQHFFSYQETADALEQAARKDLVDFSIKDGRFIVKWDVGEKAHSLIRQYRYMPPMIVPPLEVRSNRGSGYVTIKNDSLILQDNHHEGDLCLDAINRFNQIPLSINERVVKSMRNKWKHMDNQKPEESFEDYMKRINAFEKYEKDSFFTIALMIEMGNEFYLTNKYDKRGRVYCSGYHITFQGADWNKACVEFAHKLHLD